MQVDSGSYQSGTVESFIYNLKNQLTGYQNSETTASYEYGANGLRKSKTVDGTTTGYVWDRGNLAAELTGNSTKNVYNYGVDGIVTRTENDGNVTIYNKNAHGDVIGLTYAEDDWTNKYLYDAFGNQLQADNDSNPFRYCGEYYDLESGMIYLRNRYYDSSTGRFITEDPAKDGLNWYSYCNGNPVMLIDKFGLFDYNSQLTYDPNTYNNDVKVLQNELAWNGYLTDGDIDGYFGGKTLTAVNQYKNDKGLWNFGEYEGVVGLTTWQSLGLIYRTQQDINNGVEIVNVGAKQYFDVSKAIEKAVKSDEALFKEHSGDLMWFRSIVGDQGKWNVKRNSDVWSSTLGISAQSYGTTMFFFGRVVVMDDIGNITYGYLGKAANISDWLLIGGSALNHVKNHGFSDFDNESQDEGYIKLGIDWYNGADIQVRFSAL